ncbi:lipopolysaccharide biosynthesis protein [Altericroceibacterium spongiae]|uniref:Lipopolysaccharide biosynthesis protein n=2 Tax=Altericroceibacterium spongiae TaxID=2320269 RepID=A0A420EP80_9SPHN|nr:lipopolysaccharide biosynthesis protein [Altericroceibacterium spongiae]
MQNFGWMVAGRSVAAVFSLVYLAIVTRELGVSGFGKFAIITGAAQLLANLLAFQTWQVIVQYGVTHIEERDDVKLSRLYRGALMLDVVSAIGGICAAAVILHFLAEPLNVKPTLARATLIFNIIMLLSLRSTPLGIMRLRDRFSLAAAAESTQPTFRLLGALACWFTHPTLQGFLVAWAVAELMTAAAHWYGVYKIGDMPLILGKWRDQRKVLEDNPDIVRFALTTNFSQSLSMTVRQLPLFLVGGLTGTAAAGAFRLAAQLTRSLTLVSQLVARAAFPEIVRAVRHLGVGGIAGLTLRTMRFALVVGIVVFAFAIFFGEDILEMVGGPEFGRAYISLLWLAAAGCVDLVVVGFEPSIMAAHRAQWSLIARMIGTGVLIGGAWLLEPVMGPDGVAMAVFANALTQALLLGLIIGLMVRSGEGRKSDIAVVPKD